MLRALSAVSLVVAWVGGALIFASAGLIGLDVIARNAFSAAPFASMELSRYAFAGALAFSMAHALVTRSHIRIDMLHRLLPHAYPLMGMTRDDVVHSVDGHGMLNGGHYISETVLRWIGARFLSAGSGIETRSAQQLRLMQQFGATCIVGFAD